MWAQRGRKRASGVSAARGRIYLGRGVCSSAVCLFSGTALGCLRNSWISLWRLHTACAPCYPAIWYFKSSVRRFAQYRSCLYYCTLRACLCAKGSTCIPRAATGLSETHTSGSLLPRQPHRLAASQPGAAVSLGDCGWRRQAPVLGGNWDCTAPFLAAATAPGSGQGDTVQPPRTGGFMLVFSLTLPKRKTVL